MRWEFWPFKKFGKFTCKTTGTSLQRLADSHFNFFTIVGLFGFSLVMSTLAFYIFPRNLLDFQIC